MVTSILQFSFFKGNCNINSVVSQLITQIERVLPPQRWRKFPVLVAVSGGPDSAALLRLMHSISNQGPKGQALLWVGHVNHGLRGSESDADEQFVRELANQLSLPCLVERGRVATGKDSRVGSQHDSEENLRSYRYEALLNMAKQSAARYIFTGHTLDDQAETILFRFLRGTGIAGLAGIPTIRVIDETVSIIRPLLHVTRTEIEALLSEFNQPYRIDSSNGSSAYTRNFLRNEWLPSLQNRFGNNVVESIVRLGRQAAEAEHFLDEQATPLQAAIRSQSAKQVEIDLTVLKQQPPILRRQFFRTVWQQQQWPLQAMTFQWWQTLAEEAENPEQPSVLSLPGNIRAEFSGEKMVLVKK